MKSRSNHRAQKSSLSGSPSPTFMSSIYFRTVWENITDAMALSDAEGVVLAANPAYLHLYGLTTELVIGHSFVQIFPEAARPQALQQYKTVFANGGQLPEVNTQRQGPDGKPYFEAIVQRPDGSLRRVESYIEFIYEHGERVAMLSILRDVTQRTRTEAALSLSEDRQRSLVEIMPAAMFLCNEAGLITYYNPLAAELWGRHPRLNDAEDRFCGALRLYHPDDSPLPHEQSPTAIAMLTGRDTRHEELIIERPNGTRVLVSVNVKPLFDQNGGCLGAITVFEDITQRKAVEAQLQAAQREMNATLERQVAERTAELERSNRELDEFAYVASHDLKAPLRAISNLATWITEDTKGQLPVSTQVHLTKMQARIRRMEVLLDDLLAYSRAGRQRHPTEPLDLETLIRTIVELLASPTGFIVKVPTHSLRFRTERVPLETVLRNLIGNAIKHHPQPSQGWVEITAQVHEQWVDFAIQDNGSGIDSAYHQRIFELFQTLKPRDEVEGSGMGLAIVKKLVESRGGTIGLTSSLGQGTTFSFRWPTSPDLVQ